MGMTRDTNDILNRPPVAINTRQAAYVYSSSTITQSATASLTAISIQGPGVVSMFYLQVGAPQSGRVRAIIDGTTAFSVSASNITTVGVPNGLSVIGGWHSNGSGVALPVIDQVPFEQNFAVMYEFPNHSSNYAVTIIYAYRLTE